MKFNISALVVVLVFALVSCSGEDYYVSSSVDKIDASMAGEEVEFTVTSNVNWGISSSGKWVTVTPNNGNGDAVVTLKIAGNYSGAERRATLTLSSGEMLQTMEVVQPALDFSLSDNQLIFDVTGNAQTLNVTSNYSWSITVEDDAEWCQPSVLSGEGDAVVTFTPTAYDETELRKGTIIFTSGELVVEVSVSQLSSKQYLDGEVVQVQSKSATDVTIPVNLVVMGDGFTEADYMYGGTFDTAVDEAVEAFFSVEPYFTYRGYFSVYKVVAYSQQSGATVLQDFVDSTVKRQTRKTAFSSVLEGGTSTGISCDYEKVFTYAQKVDVIGEDDLPNTTVLLIINLDVYAGTASMWTSGEGIAMCPTGESFKEIVYHEGGGHAFAKLYDEYTPYATNYPDEDANELKEYREAAGSVWKWGANVSLTDNRDEVHWNHYFTLPKYEMVGIHEGADRYQRGIWRPEENSCMNDNVPYFNAPSREAIVRRIMSINGKEFKDEDFYAKDKTDNPSPVSRSVIAKRPLGRPILMKKR